MVVDSIEIQLFLLESIGSLFHCAKLFSCFGELKENFSIVEFASK